MTKELTTAQPVQVYEATPDGFIQQAIAQGANVDALEKLMALQERYQATKAREAFVQAMAAFQGECPTIEKTKEVVNNGRVMYKYAPLDTIVAKVRPILAKHNLAYTVTVEQTAEAITATCKITHSLGHSETSSFGVPIAGTGMMSAPQKVASALTYAKRYAFCNALGILTGDEDQDATDVKPDKKPLNHKAQVVFLLKSLGENVETQEERHSAVKRLTKLEPTDKNMPEIVARLEVLLSERNGDQSNID